MAQRPTRRGFLLATPIGLSAAAAIAAPADNVSAVRTVLDGQALDWNKGDLDAFLDGYWNDPGVVFQSGGDQSRGFEAMRDRYRLRYKSEGREMGKLVFSDVEILPLGPESALARGRWKLTMADGKTPGGLFTVIFRKLAGGWKIVHDHTSSV